MADCMFHGQSAPGSCPGCEEEHRRGVKRTSLYDQPEGAVEPDFEYQRSVAMGPDFHPDPLVRTVNVTNR